MVDVHLTVQVKEEVTKTHSTTLLSMFKFGITMIHVVQDTTTDIALETVTALILAETEIEL